MSPQHAGPLRVVLLITDLEYGGTPRSVQRLALALADRGHDVRVWALADGGGVAEELAAAGIPVRSFGARRSGLLRVFRGLLRALRAETPEVLHTFLFHANLLGRVAGRMAGTRAIVCSERSVESEKSRWRICADRFGGGLAHAWLVNARATSDVLQARERIDSTRIAVVPTGVDLARFAPAIRSGAFRLSIGIPADAVMLACVGRLDRYKGHRTLIEAFARVLAGGRDCWLALVGDGPLRSAVEQHARDAGVAHRVRFAGALQDVRPALADTDLFVLASSEEGMPGAVLEAMAMQVPIVATDVGGTSELLDGATGWLVPPSRSDLFSAAIEEALTDPAAARRRAAQARHTVVAGYGFERTLALTETLYERLLAGAAAPVH